MKIISCILLIVLVGVLVLVSVCVPAVLAQNNFINSFLSEQLISILSVIMTVTTASVANIHITFNRIEANHKRPGVFKDARKEINHSAILLIGLFVASIVLLILRDSASANASILAFFNGLCLIILVINVLVLLDITFTVFSISPHDEVKSDEP